MNFQDRLNQAKAKLAQSSNPVSDVQASSLPETAVLMTPEQIKAQAVAEEVVACEQFPRKDGTGFVYRVTTVSGKEILANEDFSNADTIRYTKIPAGVYTMKWDTAADDWSTSTVQTCTEDRIKVIGTGKLTYRGKLIVQKELGLLATADAGL